MLFSDQQDRARQRSDRQPAVRLEISTSTQENSWCSECYSFLPLFYKLAIFHFFHLFLILFFSLVFYPFVFQPGRVPIIPFSIPERDDSAGYNNERPSKPSDVSVPASLSR